MMKNSTWLFDRLRPIIEEKLMNPEVLESPQDQCFFRDGIDLEKSYCISPVSQLIVPINVADAGILSSDENFTTRQYKYRNVWIVCPGRDTSHPGDSRQMNVIISLKTDNMRHYALSVSLVGYVLNGIALHGQVVTNGRIAEITQAVKRNKFTSKASAVFDECLEAVTTEIEERELNDKKARLFADTVITDYDSVMKFANSVKSQKPLKSIGHGLERFAYDRVVSLINHDTKSVKLLVDRDGIAQFCTLNDFPDELLTKIRQRNKDWNLGAHNISICQFDNNGLSFMTWVISPYSYCPMDEDGFGEEEELEVAITCHIDTDGNLVGTPVWKPYTGPTR